MVAIDIRRVSHRSHRRAAVFWDYGTGAHGAITHAGTGGISAYGSDDANGVRVIQATTVTIQAGALLQLDRPVSVVRATVSLTVSGSVDGYGRAETGGPQYNYPGGGAAFPSTSSGAGGGGGGHGTSGADGGVGGAANGLGQRAFDSCGLFLLTGSTAVLGKGGNGGMGAMGNRTNPDPDGGGTGGKAGASLVLVAPRIVFSSGSLVDLRGEPGANGMVNVGQGGGGGGGGAGGLLLLIGEEIMFPASGTTVQLGGGAGGNGAPPSGGNGGNGGNGRLVAVYRRSISPEWESRIASGVLDSLRVEQFTL